MTRLERARRAANCDCKGSGSMPYVMDRREQAITHWVAKHDYWNADQSFHLIVASLVLDGGP